MVENTCGYLLSFCRYTARVEKAVLRGCDRHSSLLLKWGMRDERGKSILHVAKAYLATVQVFYSRYRREREREEKKRERAETQKDSFFLFSFGFSKFKNIFCKKKEEGRRRRKKRNGCKTFHSQGERGTKIKERKAEIIFWTNEQNFVLFFFGLEGQERSHRLLKGTC